MWRRLLLGVGANAFGQIVNIVIQVFSLPLFLLVWDVSTYGTWLLLSALPGYVGMADIGVANVAGNKMTMTVAREDYREANTVYQSAQAFMVVVCGGLAALLGSPARCHTEPPRVSRRHFGLVHVAKALTSAWA